MALKDLIIHRRAIAPVGLWAAVGTPKRGRRWIDWTTLSITRDGCVSQFLSNTQANAKDWAYWAAHGWTVERVTVSASLSAKESPEQLREAVIEAATLLLERLDDFESELDGDDTYREYGGHVAPAKSRLRAALKETGK